MSPRPRRCSEPMTSRMVRESTRVATRKLSRGKREEQEVPVGDCQREFGELARRDGIELVETTGLGLTYSGHLALPPEVGGIAALLADIFRALEGDEQDLASGHHGPLLHDWFHPPSRTLIEVDEYQHFSSDRLTTLKKYPNEARLGFDLLEYQALCHTHNARADKYRYAKEARGFRCPGGRRAQRAYFDTLRDLALPALGFPPVVRVPATENDAALAYGRVKKRLKALLETGTR